MTKVYYKTEHNISLTNEQMQQIVNSLRGHKIYKYSKKCNEFYLGHAICQARDLGIADIPSDFEVPDSAMLIAERVEDAIEYNLYD